MTTPKRKPGRPQAMPDPREFIPRLRAAGVPDAIIASTMGLSKQAIHARYGPRPVDAPRLQPAPYPQPPRQPRQNGAQPPEARAGILLSWRKRRCLTQAAAADALGVNASTWARWESSRAIRGAPVFLLRLLTLMDKES